MLKQLRQRKTMKRILWGLVILIIPPFVFWGVGSMRTKQEGPNCAGYLFGKEVSFEDYQAAFAAARNQALMVYGPKINEMGDELNMGREAWIRLILLREARKKRIRASDREVAQAIGKFPFFQSKGRFDTKAYAVVVKQAFRTDPRAFEEQMRDSISISKLRDSVVNGVRISDDEIRKEYKNANEKTIISYMLVSPAAFEKYVPLNETTLKSYYEKHAELFRVGEEANCEYLGFEAADYLKSVQVSDEDVKTYYERHKEEFDSKEDFDKIKNALKESLLQQKARGKALDAAEDADYLLSDETKSLEDASREKSVPIKETGFFQRQGMIPGIGWFPEMQDTAFTLEPGQRGKLIKSRAGFAKGFYIIRLKEKRPSYIPSFQEAKPKIERTIKTERSAYVASMEASRLHKKINELIKTKKLAFKDATTAVKRSAREAGPFSRNGYVEGVGAAAELGEAAFDAKAAEAFIAKTRAGFCIFTVAGVTPVDEEKFRKDKEEFAKNALEAKKAQYLNEWYYKLIESSNLKSNIPM